MFSVQPFSSELHMFLSGPKLHALVLDDLAFRLLWRVCDQHSAPE